MTTDFPGLPAGFGDGWLSANAHDEMQIAILFGGFPRKELVQRVVLASTPGRKVTTRTVERVLQEMYDAHRTAHPELYSPTTDQETP
jgi:hypothetical protein